VTRRPFRHPDAQGHREVATRVLVLSSCARWVFLLLLSSWLSVPLRAQAVSYRGFVEFRGVVFPQDAPNDGRNVVGDALARGEVFLKPAPWVQCAAGVDVRANTYDQVADSWRPDISDRTPLRPRVSVRRLNATLSRGPITVDVGRQFIRWGKTDIVAPTDRFAPRDLLNVIEGDFLAVNGARGLVALGSETIDAVWVPYFTPSRTPLLDQRWTVVPSSLASIPLVDMGSSIPRGSQAGVRWSHTGSGYEYSASFFRGFNHLPNVETAVQRPAPVDAGSSETGDPAVTSLGITRTYPSLSMVGGDVAVSMRWFTVKGETGYFTSSTPGTEEYVLYVVQLERQSGEWLFIGGYAGDVVTAEGSSLAFAADRGSARAVVARASYTIDSNRSTAFETAIRQDGSGFHAKGEYSQARGQHWRATVSASLVRGDADDFIGQYRLNSHVVAALRYSY
jgi:hypothetical protein